MVAGLLGNESSESNRFTLVTPKPANGVRLQATLGNQNPTGLPVGAVSKKQVHGLTIKEVLDSLPEAVCFSLLDGTLLFVNKRMLGIIHTLTGHDLTSLSVLEAYLDEREMIEINGKVYAIK